MFYFGNLRGSIMSQRDYNNHKDFLDGYDEDSIREVRASLIRKRNSLFCSQFDIQIYDLMIKELDERYPNARFEQKGEQKPNTLASIFRRKK